MSTFEHIDLNDEDLLQVNERSLHNIILHIMTIAEAATKNVIIFDHYHMNIEGSIQD